MVRGHFRVPRRGDFGYDTPSGQGSRKRASGILSGVGPSERTRSISVTRPGGATAVAPDAASVEGTRSRRSRKLPPSPLMALRRRKLYPSARGSKVHRDAMNGDGAAVVPRCWSRASIRGALFGELPRGNVNRKDRASGFIAGCGAPRQGPPGRRVSRRRAPTARPRPAARKRTTVATTGAWTRPRNHAEGSSKDQREGGRAWPRPYASRSRRGGRKYAWSERPAGLFLAPPPRCAPVKAATPASPQVRSGSAPPGPDGTGRDRGVGVRAIFGALARTYSRQMAHGTPSGGFPVGRGSKHPGRDARVAEQW